MKKYKSVFLISGLLAFIIIFTIIKYNKINNKEENYINKFEIGEAATDYIKKNEEEIINEDKNMIPWIFLTFDDGPSFNTLKILDILEKEDISGTFFVTGKNIKSNENIVKRSLDDGNVIASHSYSHNYNIYKNIDDFTKDFELAKKQLADISDKITLNYYRFPGGSDNTTTNKSNLLKVKKFLASQKVDYIDWNCSSADSAFLNVSVDLIIKNVLNGVKGNNIKISKYKKYTVVLMHDSNTKGTTALALPEIIHQLKKEGFKFKTLKDITPEVKTYLINMGIINKKWR